MRRASRPISHVLAIDAIGCDRSMRVREVDHQPAPKATTRAESWQKAAPHESPRLAFAGLEIKTDRNDSSAGGTPLAVQVFVPAAAGLR
jgi:hypothetical protein